MNESSDFYVTVTHRSVFVFNLPGQAAAARRGGHHGAYQALAVRLAGLVVL